MNRSVKSRMLSLFLALLMSLPLGVFSSLGIFAETTSANDATTTPTASQVPTLTNTTDVAYASWSGNEGNSGLSSSAMKRYLASAWALLPNGGTLVIPAKGYVEADLTLPAATAPIVITARDVNGTMYYAGPGTEENTQAGMIMVKASKTITFQSDVIFQDIAILQRDSQTPTSAATYVITNGATMVIEDSVDFLYSKTVNPALVNSKISVDAGAKLIVKSAGALSYSGEGSIYVDKNLIGNGISADQFNAFTGALYDLEGKALCDITGHTYSLDVVDHKYVNICSSCGHNGGDFTYTEPVVSSTDKWYWGYNTGNDSNNGTSADTPIKSATAVAGAVNNGGTLYVTEKGYAGGNAVMDFGGTTLVTAVGPDGYDYRETVAQYGALMWEQSGNAVTMTFVNDVIFKDINIYNRSPQNNVMAITNNSTAVFENVVLKTSGSSYPKMQLSIEAGSTVIMKGNNVGTFSKIIGKGTLVVDMDVVNAGKLKLAQLEEFDGVIMTTECKEICAFTGGHDYVDGTCSICGTVEGTVTKKYYVAQGATGDGSSPDNPTNSIRKGFDVASADPIEIILVDDVTIGGAIVCNDNSQDITIKSIDVDGDGVYPKLILQSYIVFDNAGFDNTITIKDLEICSDREGTALLFFCYNNFTIGKGVTCTLSGNYADTALYPTIYAGYLESQGDNTVAAKSQNADCTAKVSSGTWTAYIGGNRRAFTEKVVGYNIGNMTTTVTGGHFVGDDNGVSFAGVGMNFYEGNIDINIQGGTFDKNIYGIHNIGVNGGLTPFEKYGYKGDVSIDITGGTLKGDVHAKYVREQASLLVRGNVSVTVGDAVTISSAPMLVDLRGTQAYSGQYKVSSLTFSNTMAAYIDYKFVDVVNGTATNMGEPERIAFVGDSITQGTGASDVDVYSYPVQIQNMLNKDEYMIGNFGVGASGILPTTRYWYNDTLKYHLLLEEFEPTIISFALGTNDANAVGGAEGTLDYFEELYYDLLCGYADIPTVKEIYIATPILRFNSPQHQYRLISLQIPAIRSIASKLDSAYENVKVTLVEMNAITFDNVVAGNVLGTDELHPNDAGYTILAQAFYNAIFNGVVGIPSSFKSMNTVYVSDYGTRTGAGTYSDPISDFGIALAKVNRAGGSIVIVDDFTLSVNVNTPSDMTGTLTIKGYDSSSTLVWTKDTFRLHGDVKFDNIIFHTTGDTPYIIGQYNSVTFTNTFKTVCDGAIDLVFVAGYHAYGDISLTNTSEVATYDTVASASSANNATINIEGGTFGAIVLGNRRMASTSVVGTYSGNMTANLTGGTLTGRCQTSILPSTILGMNYLSGNITVNFSGIDLQGTFYGIIRTGTLSYVTYDSKYNTGSILVNGTASVLDQIIVNQLNPGDALYASINNFKMKSTSEPGDIDENGMLTNADITLIIRYLNGWSVIGAKFSGDVNCDEKVNNRDAIEIIIKLSGDSWRENYTINSFYDLNQTSNTVLSHENETSYNDLELDYRSFTIMGESQLGTAYPHYPRIKKMENGRYIMFYQDGKHSNNVYYATSKNLKNWSAPKLLFDYTKVNKSVRYATCDAVVLDNGDILAICSYRSSSYYDTNPQKNGLVMKRSTNNGVTWSDEQKIYVGTNWEPYPIQLSSGEIQVYFTNTTCYYNNELIDDTSTGTAMIRSYDNGVTWTGDLSVPYSGQIVSQTPTRVADGVQLYSDQMPSAIELLGSGNMMLALETRHGLSGPYKVSISYSSDNWKTPLAANQTGPTDKITDAFAGAGPYLRQFISGEVVLSSARQRKFTYRMFSPDGRSYSSVETQPFASYTESEWSGYWGSLELVGSHTMVGITDTFISATDTDGPGNLDYGKLNLNHSIKAKKMTAFLDGDAKEWINNDEAFFIGSVSQAQASVRSASDSEAVYFLIERLDDYLTSDTDTVTLYFAASKTSATYYRLNVNANGVVSYDYYNGSSYSKVSKEIFSTSIINGTLDSDSDTDVGYSVEIKIPYTVLGGVRTEFSMYLALDNEDKGVQSATDTLVRATLSDKSTWLKITY